MFFRGSRYEAIADAETTDRNGRCVRYKRMRFIPSTPGAFGYQVREEERPDLVAYRALGDAEQFWRLADVNRTMRPIELTATPGRRIRVPAPGGG
ncbi:hypothetical protein [Kaistia granuli]|uniref:hypothetical protein n=1 Tax=Kaistia granuli TaxID=363259 RepID=UPI0003655E60|nr:hypothetical protein [Kaistia granuli]